MPGGFDDTVGMQCGDRHVGEVAHAPRALRLRVVVVRSVQGVLAVDEELQQSLGGESAQLRQLAEVQLSQQIQRVPGVEITWRLHAFRHVERAAELAVGDLCGGVVLGQTQHRHFGGIPQQLRKFLGDVVGDPGDVRGVLVGGVSLGSAGDAKLVDGVAGPLFVHFPYDFLGRCVTTE